MKRLFIYSLVIIVSIVLTLMRNSVWHSEYSIWKDIILKSPNKPRPYNNLGTAAERERRIDEAIIAYKKAIDLYSMDMHDPLPSLNAHYNLGLMYIEMGRKDDAVKIFKHLFSIGFGASYGDEVIDAFVKRLDILFNKTRGIHSGGAGLKPELKGEIYNSLGAAYLAIGLNELAVILFKKSLKYNQGNAEAYNNLGAAYLKMGYIDASIKEFENAVKINPELIDAYSNMGFAYSDKGDYKTALKFHLNAVELNPNYANAHYGLASIYNRFGDREKAVSHWKEYVRLSPNTPWAEEAMRYVKDAGVGR